MARTMAPAIAPAMAGAMAEGTARRDGQSTTTINTYVYSPTYVSLWLLAVLTFSFIVAVCNARGDRR